VSAAAVAVLIPVLVTGYQQREQIAWVPHPHVAALISMTAGFAGTRKLVLPVAALAVCATLAGVVPRRRHALTPGAVAVPWLVMPAIILIAISSLHPVFSPRYVFFCQPALALLAAAGLSWLAGLMASGLGKMTPASPATRALAWLPSVLIVVMVAVMVTGQQQLVRRSFSYPRGDNLRHLSRVIAAREQPGDAVLYLPPERRIAAMAYPGPFRRLRDVALLRSPVASATLEGTEVSPATLRRRFTGVQRVWLIALGYRRHLPPPVTAMDREKLALVGRLQRIRCRWAGSLIFCLYARPGHGRAAARHPGKQG
jgi:mannosyltransferase